MNNIHLIKTDKPSRLFLNKVNNKLLLDSDNYSNLEKILPSSKYQHIYITNDEKIKVNDYITDGYLVWKWKDDSSLLGRNKVILTTDKDLISNGIQKIDDDFLEWFCSKNGKVDFVEVITVEDEKN